MIIPLITLKGLIFIQAHPYQYMKNTTQTSSMHEWTFFSAVDLMQHKYLDILYNYIYNKVKYDKSAIYTLIYLNPALKPMASSGKSFGLKLYIHSMTDNIITTSNYTQLQVHEPQGYNWYIVESGVKHH